MLCSLQTASVRLSLPRAQLGAHQEGALGRAGGFSCEYVHGLAWCAMQALLEMSCVYIVLYIYIYISG